MSPTDLGTDFATKQWANAVYVVRAWGQWGEVPLWRNAAMGGVPLVGNPSILLLYPVYWLVLLLPSGWSFTLYFALHLVWAGWGVYGLARQGLRLSREAALLSSLGFALSAKIVAHIGGGHADVVAAVAWLPWLWRAAGDLARRPSWPAAAGAAVAAAAQALTHLPTLWLSALVAAGWWLTVRLGDRSAGVPRRWVWSGLAVLGASALALGLSAVQLWPMLELLPLSTRGAMTLAEASQFALPVPLLIGLVFPPALAFPEWVVYAGIVTLALAPASWLARRRVRGWRFCVSVVILATAFSLGRAGLLFPALFRILPGMDWLRVPTRAMFLGQLAWSLLAAMGWDGLRQTNLRVSPALLGWWMVLPVLTLVGAAWTRRFPGVLAVPAASAVLAVFPLTVLVGRTRLRFLQSCAPGVLAVLLVVEAVMLAPRFVTGVRISELAAAAPAVSFLAAQEGRFRVYSPGGSVSLAQAVVHDLETVDGSDPFQFAHYVRWANAAAGCEAEAYAVGVPTCAADVVQREAFLRARPDGLLLGIGSVRYVATDCQLPEWPPVWQSGALRVYENPDVLPRAFVVPTIAVASDDVAALGLLQARRPSAVATVPRTPQDAVWPGGMYRPAQVSRWSPNRIDLQAEGPGWLVVSQVWVPGWRAHVDGVRAEVQRTDVTFCGLALPDGSHAVTLTYAPVGWLWGRWISLGTAVGMVLATTVAVGLRRRARR